MQQDVTSKSNIKTVNSSAGDNSDTSESDPTAIDDEDEHLSLEDLAKAAEHVKELLRGMTVLQQTVGGNRKTRRRVRKMYQRFCHKFESGMKASQRDSLPTQNDTNDKPPLDEYVILTSQPENSQGSTGGSFIQLENCDFDHSAKADEDLPLRSVTGVIGSDDDANRNEGDGHTTTIAPEQVRYLVSLLTRY